MSNDVPTKPGYYKDFEGDTWRLEGDRANNWTLRPGQPGEKRNAGDFWRYQPMHEIPTPAGLPEVQYWVEVINPAGQRIVDLTMDTLAEAEEFRNSAQRNDGYQYRILRIETTEVSA